MAGRIYVRGGLCVVCGGRRLRPESLAVDVGGLSIADFTSLAVSKARPEIDRVRTGLTPRQLAVAGRALGEIAERLDFLLAMGLGYLSLTRSAATLSGGEAQRIRLATQIGSRLRGVLYVLDEPSIGLHARDNTRLLESLEQLRDLGNTVLVVEHDEETIRRADFVVDLGPGAGNAGGQVVAIGPPGEIAAHNRSLTGKYLSGKVAIPVPAKRRVGSGKAITLLGCEANNLKNLDVRFPLGVLTVVTGVSGSGKSTLVNDLLYRALAQRIYRSMEQPGRFRAIEGADNIDKVVEIDQAPIGRSPRSNPATYTGVFAPIRELYAMLPESRERGYKPGRFSFNVKGGRCEACQGDGLRRIEMNFLPDVYVTCEVCRGRRYNSETLAVQYKGYSIADLLNLPIAEALGILENIPAIRQKLETLVDVGLGYVQLGQSSTTLSGGEAQRIKLARELSRRQDVSARFTFLTSLTTGLHSLDDVRKLLDVLHRLTDLGNTVLIIEHHLDVIKQADWIIDLGPEGGEAGGRIVAQGTPEQVVRVAKSYTGQALAPALAAANNRSALESAAESGAVPAGLPPAEPAAASRRANGAARRDLCSPAAGLLGARAAATVSGAVSKAPTMTDPNGDPLKYPEYKEQPESNEPGLPSPPPAPLGESAAASRIEPPRDTGIAPDLRTPHRGVDLFVLAVFYSVSGTVLFLFAAAIAHYIFGVSTAAIQDPAGSKASLIIISQALLSGVTIAFLALLVRLRGGVAFWPAVGWRPFGKEYRLPSTVIVLCLSGGRLSSGDIHRFCRPLHQTATSALPMDELFQSRQSVLLLMAVGILVAPLVEETIFRGCVYPIIARRFGIAAGILSTGVLFGPSHHAPQLWPGYGQIGILTGVGLVLTYIRARAGTVAASFFVHLSYNSVVLFGYYFATGGLRHLPG